MACLQAVAKRRAVLLVTCFVAEVDALADRIGIVSSRVLALSGREELKKRVGDVYHIRVVPQAAPRTMPQKIHTTKDWVRSTTF